MTGLYFIAAVIAALYIGGPLLVKRMMNMNIRAPLAPLEYEQLPAAAQILFEQTSPPLQNLGFEVVAHFEMRGALGTVTPVVTLWVNRRTAQAAAAVVTYTHASGQPIKNQRYLEFSTKMADGMAVMTSNSAQIGSFWKFQPPIRSTGRN